MEDEAPLVRRARCSGCAFTPGTEASECPLTRVKAESCVLTGTYFYCHRDATDTYNLRDGEALCAGWLQAVTKRIESGEMEATPGEERAEALVALDAIENIEDHLAQVVREGRQR